MLVNNVMLITFRDTFFFLMPLYESTFFGVLVFQKSNKELNDLLNKYHVSYPFFDSSPPRILFLRLCCKFVAAITLY